MLPMLHHRANTDPHQSPTSGATHRSAALQTTAGTDIARERYPFSCRLAMEEQPLLSDENKSRLQKLIQGKLPCRTAG